MMQNKKGVEINITTIIILVLAILVLVILGLFFSGTLKSLWEKIVGIQGVYVPDALNAARDKCENFFSIQQYCTEKVGIYNGQNKTTDYFYCWDLGRLNANYKATYTYNPTGGEPIKVSTEAKCIELNYPKPE